MSKIVSFLFLCYALILVSCIKESEDPIAKQMEEDKRIIEAHVAANQLTGAYTDHGAFYSLANEGTGAVPVVRNGVLVKYTERILGGAVFDTGTVMFQFGLPLNHSGWNIALSTMKKGQTGKFLIPSYYAFGSGAGTVKNVPIPANSIIEMDMEVLDIVEEAAIIDSYLNYLNIDYQKTASGLCYHYLDSGAGKESNALSRITINYYGQFVNKRLFDPGADPLTFTVGQNQVVDGMDEAAALLRGGDEVMLYMPYTLGYGAQGYDIIPPYSILVFNVKVANVD